MGGDVTGGECCGVQKILKIDPGNSTDSGALPGIVQRVQTEA